MSPAREGTPRSPNALRERRDTRLGRLKLQAHVQGASAYRAPKTDVEQAAWLTVEVQHQDADHSSVPTIC